MSRIRSIKPEFPTSEQTANCSRDARLLFILMWCFCDDYGIHPDSPKRLKMECFPGDDLPDAQVAAMLDELVEAGLLTRYRVEGRPYLSVTGWSKHQKVEHPRSLHPGPDKADHAHPEPVAIGPVADDSPKPRAPSTNVRESSTNVRPASLLKGVEERGLDTDRPNPVAAREASKNIRGDPSARFARLDDRPAKTVALKATVKEQLRSKLFRFVNAVYRGDRLTEAIDGLMADDPRDAQLWFDKLDADMRRRGWDDVRDFENERAGMA